MASDQVVISHCAAGAWASIRELCGHDEWSVQSKTTAAAIALIDRLLGEVPGTGIGPGSARRLTAADRDRILAAVYSGAYGRAVRSEVVCRTCTQRFDLDFALDDLLRDVTEGVAKRACRSDSAGVFELKGGVRFRLPTGDDECAVLGWPSSSAEEALLSACIIEGDPGRDGGEIQQAMAELAPIVSADLGAQCPECGSTQDVQFDLQDYLLGALLRDRTSLAEEVHVLAMSYGWGLSEILGLPRSQRRALISLVDRSTPARWR